VQTGVKVIFVTHQFTLADLFSQRGLDTALFLRAERAADGRRTFKLVEGEPLPTSFGEDLYHRIGGFARHGTTTGGARRDPRMPAQVGTDDAGVPNEPSLITPPFRTGSDAMKPADGRVGH